jgi:hypothetical protein
LLKSGLLHRVDGTKDKQIELIEESMEQKIDHKTERATDICNEIFRKEKIFICDNEETYERLVYIIKNMQEAPASGLKAEVAYFKKNEQTRSLKSVQQKLPTSTFGKKTNYLLPQ